MEKEEESKSIRRLFASFVCVLRYHVCDLTRVESINQVDSSGCKSTLEFSCAICDRFGAINRSVRYFEFAQGESALHLEKYLLAKIA